MTTPRRCEWCGEPPPSDAPLTTVTCSPSHRALRWRWLNDVHRAGGRPPVPPPEGSPLLAMNDAARKARAKGGRKPSKAGGVTIAWGRAVEELARFLGGGVIDERARERAALILSGALSDRQRERLEARK